MVRSIAWLLLLPCALGCVRGGPSAPDGGEAALDPRRCGPAVRGVGDEGAAHVPMGQAVSYRSNPPASGPHWPEWARWDSYPYALDREQWVHNLEHGGIVLLYNCPGVDGGGAPVDGGLSDGGTPRDGGLWPCPEITTPLRQLRDERGIDKWGIVRLLVTGDPKAPRRVSAVAWGWLYEADQVDPAALRCFIDARYGRGPEDAP